MEHPEYLPMGSVCTIKGSEKKLMIINRGVLLPHKGEPKGVDYFDYGACLYPDGLVGDQVMYFNHDTVEDVCWEGFKSKEDSEYLQQMKEGVERFGVQRGNPSSLKAQMSKENLNAH